MSGAKKGVLLMLFVGIILLPVSAKMVTVGFYPDGNYMYKTPDGQYRGYNIEYLYELSKYNGWTYRFIEFPSLQENIDALNSGEVDILPAYLYTPKGAAKYLMSEKGMGTIYTTLLVRNGDTQYSFGDIESFQDMRVGIIKGSVEGERFKNWAKGKNLTIRTVDVPSLENVFILLRDKKIDGAAVTYQGPVNGCRVVAEFYPTTMYFALPLDRQDLKRELDDAMDKMTVTNPQFEFNLGQQYLSLTQNDVPVFSALETAYVTNATTARVVVLADDAPFSFVDAKGNIKGIIPDLFSRIHDLSGLNFRFITVSSQQQAIALVKEKNAEIIAPIIDDSALASSRGVYLTNPFLHMTVARVSLNKDNGGTHIIALPEGDVSSAYNKKQIGGQVILYPSVGACFNALRKGEVGVIYCPMTGANVWLSNHHAGEYLLTSMSSYSYDVSIGVRSTTPTELFSIINTCIRYTDSSILDEMTTKNSLVQERSIQAVFERMPSTTIVILVLILLLMVIILVFAVVTLINKAKAERKIAKEREESERRQSLLDALSKANEAKSNFLSSVSHDMRTPLNGIIGFIDLARSCTEMDTIQNYLDKIKISSSILLDLINDTLELSKMENGKLHITPEPIDTFELIDHITVPMKAACEAKSIKFVLDLTNVPDEVVMADRINVQKVFLNLIGNAVKFTPQDGKIEFILSMEDSRTLKAVVKDNGRGMSADFMETKLFQPFSQEKRNEAASQAGSGLGLSIVKQLVSLMNGTISVQSKLGEGTAFTVILPFEVATEEQKRAKNQNKENVEKDFSDLKGKRMLLCEDNHLNTEIARSILEHQGVEVFCAENGKAGLDMFVASNTGFYDVILMDIRMPVMDGYQATSAIRALPRKDAVSIPIVFMTADAPDETMRSHLEKEANGYVSKPINPQFLFSLLLKLTKA